MPTVTLPSEPSLEQLKKLARALQAADAVPLHEAQRRLARRYGFPSWPRMKAFVVAVEGATRKPDLLGALPSPGDELVRLACLTYGADSPARPEAARQLLAAAPALVRSSFSAAVAAGAVDEVAAFLADDPALATAEGGPHRWEPLLTLAYSRAIDDEAALVAVARLLLEHGADPDAGYLWHGLPSPFTALTGALGGGEGGQAAPPGGLALARVLLEAGADPNDGQALYNRMFGSDDSHLELLFAHGLGTPRPASRWVRLLDGALESPHELLQRQVWWACQHHMADRLRLLASHGVPLDQPLEDGRTPAEHARLTGDPALADLLVALGAPPPAPSPADELVAAVVAADAAEVERLLAARPGLVQEARAAWPSVAVRAVVDGGPDAVRLAHRLGFDLDALGRHDSLRPDPWETPLHCAVRKGDAELVQLLVALGASTDVRDHRFDATPLGWAEHLGHEDLAALLRAVPPSSA